MLLNKYNMVYKRFKTLEFSLILYVCFGISFPNAFAQNESSGHSANLTRAYELRSSDFLEAKRLLLSVDKNALNNKEKDLYKFTSAFLLFMSGDYSGAIEAYRLLTDSNNSFDLRFNAYSALTALNAATQNWSEAFVALEYLLENIDSVQKAEDKEQAHNAIINLYSLINESETVVSYATPLLNNEYSKRFTCMLNMHLLVAQVNINEQGLSEETFLHAVELCKQANESIPITVLYSQYGHYQYKQNELEKAERTLILHLKDAEATKYRPLLDEYYTYLAQVYFKLEDLDNAQKYALLTVGEDNTDEYTSTTDADAFYILVQIAELNAEYQSALQFHKRYTQAKSFNISSDNAKTLAIQKARQDSDRKSHQIVLLDAENSLLKTQAELTNEANNNRRLLFGFLLLILFICIFWIYKKRSHFVELEEISQKDSLTGVANRHFFTQKSRAILQECRHNKVDVCLIVFDLDNFKQINDKHGHLEGDRALTESAIAAKSVCRELDLIGRLGGEEFGVLLYGCGLDKVLNIAEKCRSEIDKLNRNNDRAYVLTASFGVSSAGECGYVYDMLFDTADKAMYRAKNSGKNRVC